MANTSDMLKLKRELVTGDMTDMQKYFWFLGEFKRGAQAAKMAALKALERMTNPYAIELLKEAILIG